MDSLAHLPLPYYLCVLALAGFSWNAWKSREEAWGIPMLAVLVTVGAWYLMDPIYNGYQAYVNTFGEGVLSTAWWEVLLFLISLAVLAPVMSKKINGGLAASGSQVFMAIRSNRIDTDEFQDQIQMLSKYLLIGWCALMAVGLWRIDFNFMSLFFPYLVGDLSSPWYRQRIGGSFDAILSLANYFQVMLTALWGVVLVLAKRPRIQMTAALVYFLAEPFYLFDRTRNTMLATLLPGLMALVTLRMRSSVMVKIAVLGAAFAMLNVWFLLVLEIRSQSGTLADAFKSGALSAAQKEGGQHKKKHEGFNMFEELGYINYFTDKGTYRPNWGNRYFAELVNPVPRVLWPSKPLIGVDYAIARGLAYGAVDAKEGGVAATVSTGMIGQGVVNFDKILGPIAAALLMAIWVALLARQDLLGHDIGHLLLYAIGLVLTFNMGRDITLLTIYPFIFGWLLLNWLNRNKVHPALVQPHETRSIR
jgi:hypothetical protein